MNLFEKRWSDYKQYHIDMTQIGDCDPAYPALEYVANRFELNLEQRYWLAFLYATCYCSPTVYYMYNEFPDYENVDARRLQNWWLKNKHKTIFQTDRLKVKSFDMLLSMFIDYRERIGESQQLSFEKRIVDNPIESYNNLYKFASTFYYMGRFTLFIYLECLKFLTKLPIEINSLELEEAESSRNGLCYAVGRDDLVVRKNNLKLTKTDYTFLQEKLDILVGELKNEYPSANVSYWSVETSLCSYKKMYWRTRYLGYYIDRLMVEILEMQNRVTDGVDWTVMWDFRKEHFPKEWLGEYSGWQGIRRGLMGMYNPNQILERQGGIRKFL
jgi:hypothetical protein